MKFREHRGSLGASMDTMVELETRAQLIDHVKKMYSTFVHGFNFDDIVVEPYYMTPDSRCGWEQTYVVRLDGFGVIGFTDSPVEAGGGIEPPRSGI